MWARIQMNFTLTFSQFIKISIERSCFCAVASPPTYVTAVQGGPTSITVGWTPSVGASGYRIQYDSSGGSSGSETVSGGDTNSYTLTALTNGDTYTISIVATLHFSSDPVTAQTAVPLGK